MATSQSSSTIIDALSHQTEDLCQVHNHITQVIADLDVSQEMLSDGYSRPNKSDFTFESAILMYLYQHARGFDQSELHRRLAGTAYVYIRFDLPRPPTQQAISYIWRNRFSLADRRTIKATARAVREIAISHDIVSDDEPLLDPSDIDAAKIADDHIMSAVEAARDRGLDEFDSERASNATFDDLVFFERQGYLNIANRGTTTRSRGTSKRFGRISDREETPHGDTHLRTMKKTAAPPEQTTLDDYDDGLRPTDWERIRDEVLTSFHRGIETILEEVRVNGGIREPVIAAIDITPWPVFSSPYKDAEDVAQGDESVVVNGEERYPREEYPEMVHGLKERHEHGYEMATITIIEEDTPIVLGVEPVRRRSDWETGDTGDTSQARIVKRLLKQAEQHVDIHKVFCDRGFDANGVRDAIDRHNTTYLIPKRKYAAEIEDVEELERETVTGAGVVRNVPYRYEGRVHTGSIMYVPSTKEEGSYAVFTTNRDVPVEQVQGFVTQYAMRWEIENEYKTIKKHFLPTVGSMDYRIRFLYFVIGVVMYNVWRLTNLLFREAVDVHLGERSPIPAGEFIEILAFCIVPGD
ncbi:transposase [Halococcus hamelinensis]|uniref:Transposase IS4 family protein n=1 Tax=Halococcus hamelinensis 100A6 TaxID=1132509 RepID=M0M072_9EURY|nr:transposase [Halococcus hamelinensis]EMA37785.1 transposase IS4 family protein [Halococcus hamelinensis 100A6]